jgi:hypothetical protein
MHRITYRKNFYFCTCFQRAFRIELYLRFARITGNWLNILLINIYHMNIRTFANVILLSLLPSLFIACKKDNNPSPPVISLKSGSSYTASGSIIAIGHPIHFGITASSSDANITNLVVKKLMPDGTSKVVFDTGMNTASFDINKTFYQGIEEEAKWTFQVMDKNRQFATTDRTFYKDPNSSWGGIIEYPSLTMGYQNNTEFGQFLDPSTGKIYHSDTASLNQSLIQIITYYVVDDNLPSPTFSSAGELGGGITEYYPVIDQWTTKNYTKWDISVDSDPIDAAAYRDCHNDSLLILSYDDVWGKRKFKWSDPGDIIPFLTATGKKGLLQVISADHDPSGKITFSLKIQQ